MIKSAAAVTTLLLPLFAATAFAEGDAPETTTAGTLVVVTPNAPIIVTNNANAQAVGGPSTVQPQGAAEMPVPAPAGPPQNEDWNNVSHINGTPVPVGERTNYLYSFKKTNISSNPIAWMFGYYQVAAAHAVSNNVAVSVEVSAWDANSGNDSGYQIAGTLPIYFKKTFQGPFLEGGLVIHNDNHPNYVAYDCYDCSSTGNSTWVGPEVMFGWSWMFDSGLNVSAAFGAAKRMSTNSMSSSSDDPLPAGYFRVGYAF